MQSFETLMGKLANGTLTQSDKAELAQIAGEIDSVRSLSQSWVKAGSQSPTFFQPTIDSPRWRSSPLQAAFALMTSGVSISNNTITYITFETSTNFGDLWKVDGAKVSWKGVEEKAFQLSGYAIWTASATGYRGLWIEGFDANDVSLGTSPLHTFPGSSLVDNVFPISFSFYYNNFSYLKFYVLQTSGGNLILKDLVVGMNLV